MQIGLVPRNSKTPPAEPQLWRGGGTEDYLTNSSLKPVAHSRWHSARVFPGHIHIYCVVSKKVRHQVLKLIIC